MRLKEVRQSRSLTQADVAESLHIKQNTYSQYESGLRQVPVSVLVELSEIYGVTVDYLLGRTRLEDKF